MNDNLGRDALIVFAIWFGVAYAWSGFPITGAPMILSGVLLVWLVGIAAGAAAVWIVNQGRMHLIRRPRVARKAHSTRELAEAKIMDTDGMGTLYSVPLPVVAEPAKGRVAHNRLQALPWWTEYAKSHPAYAYVLEEVYRVMASKPGIPASPSGGHGGLSLVDHSMNVLDAMLRLAPEWRYTGIRNKTGAIIVPLQDKTVTELRIDQPTPLGCPILPLLAFAHDIGKVACYEMVGDKVVSVLPRHGVRGAALLRTLRAVDGLPLRDRDALLLGVEFYHGLFDMPTTRWIDDRVRSLTALLYVADCDASDQEGDRAKDAEEARRLYLATPAPAADQDPSVELTVPVHVPEKPSAPGTPAQTELWSAQHGGGEKMPSSPSYTATGGASALDLFLEAIETPGAVNGKDRSKRIAWKHGEWLYVMKDGLLPSVAGIAGDLTLIQPKQGSGERFMTALLHDLAARGLLLTQHEGETREPGDALWSVKSARSADVQDTTTPYAAFIVRVDVAIQTAQIPDCAYPPQIVSRSQPGPTRVAIALDALMDDDFVLPPLPPLPSEAPAEDGHPPETGAPTVYAEAPQWPQRSDRNAGSRRGLSSDAKARHTSQKHDTFTCNGIVLTYDALANLAACGSPEFGLRLKEINGKRLAVFDRAQLAKAFVFDIEALPDDVRHLVEQDVLVVAL